MVDYLVRPVIHEAFYKKYANKKFMNAFAAADKAGRTTIQPSIDLMHGLTPQQDARQIISNVAGVPESL